MKYSDCMYAIRDVHEVPCSQQLIFVNRCARFLLASMRDELCTPRKAKRTWWQ